MYLCNIPSARASGTQTRNCYDGLSELMCKTTPKISASEESHQDAGAVATGQFRSVAATIDGAKYPARARTEYSRLLTSICIFLYVPSLRGFVE